MVERELVMPEGKGLKKIASNIRFRTTVQTYKPYKAKIHN
jgi:hypothetical protein